MASQPTGIPTPSCRGDRITIACACTAQDIHFEVRRRKTSLPQWDEALLPSFYKQKDWHHTIEEQPQMELGRCHSELVPPHISVPRYQITSVLVPPRTKSLVIWYQEYHITNAKANLLVKWYRPVIWYPCTESLAIFRAIIIYTPSWLHGTEEPAAMEGTSAAGPTTGLEGTDLAGPSSRGEVTSVACAGACSVEVDVGRPSSRIGEETGLSRNNWSAARFGPGDQFRRAITGLPAP